MKSLTNTCLESIDNLTQLRNEESYEAVKDALQRSIDSVLQVLLEFKKSNE